MNGRDSDQDFEAYDPVEDRLDIDDDDLNPIAVYRRFVTDDLLTLIVDETNTYAEQSISGSHRQKSRANDWVPTNNQEIMRFLGIIILMGLVRLPSVDMYWTAKKTDLYNVPTIKTAMTRARFRLLLRFIHFADKNDTEDLEEAEKRIHKIKRLITDLNANLQDILTLGRNVVIDESSVLFRGRLSFKQYTPLKAHKYGIKVFKLAIPNSYTLMCMVYVGKGTVALCGKLFGHAIVMELMANFLDAGRVLFVDNYYSGLPRAHELLDRKTYACGTAKVTRKGLPPPFVKSDLAR